MTAIPSWTKGTLPRGSACSSLGLVGCLQGPPLTSSPFLLQPRQNLLQAAGAVGQTSGELLQQIGESDADPHFQVSGKRQSSGAHLAGDSLAQAAFPLAQDGQWGWRLGPVTSLVLWIRMQMVESRRPRTLSAPDPKTVKGLSPAGAVLSGAEPSSALLPISGARWPRGLGQALALAGACSAPPVAGALAPPVGEMALTHKPGSPQDHWPEGAKIWQDPQEAACGTLRHMAW